MKLSEDAVEALTAALFESADTDQNGCITFEELCAVLDKHPDVLNNLTIRWVCVNFLQYFEGMYL